MDKDFASAMQNLIDSAESQTCGGGLTAAAVSILNTVCEARECLATGRTFDVLPGDPWWVIDAGGAVERAGGAVEWPQ